MDKLDILNEDIQRCTLCESALTYPPQPVINIGLSPSLLIIGQAPGLEAHRHNKPFYDKSGERLRMWLGLEESVFYDPQSVSIMPMGFCFPGSKNNADAPPRKECAPKWHRLIIDTIKPNMRIIVGRYAQQYHLPQFNTLTDAINACSPTDNHIVLPHPSDRNNRWMAKHPWFEARYLPDIQARIQRIIKN